MNAVVFNLSPRLLFKTPPVCYFETNLQSCSCHQAVLKAYKTQTRRIATLVIGECVAHETVIKQAFGIKLIVAENRMAVEGQGGAPSLRGKLLDAQTAIDTIKAMSLMRTVLNATESFSIEGLFRVG